MKKNRTGSEGKGRGGEGKREGRKGGEERRSKLSKETRGERNK